MPSAKEKLLKKMYDKMLEIRRFEEAAAKAYSERKIRGFCHLYIGEEAVATGAIFTLNENDYVIATYREHGHALARGMDPNAIMAELFGKETGCSKGLGGSMHLFDVNKRFMGGHGIVGGHVSVAAGLAFASQYQRKREVTLCFMGEGATNIGGFHEGLSLAALWNLPVVYIVENNLYAMGTPVYRSQHTVDISQKAEGYGIPRARIEGNDPMLVYETVKEAVNRARALDGPTLIEVITYRYRGHSMTDPAKYRSKEELERYQKKDAIVLTKKKLLKAGYSEEELEEADKKAKEIAKQAVEFAENSDFPPVSDLEKYVYV
ncbi:MAG: pyruvate dehydrogenase (acetyl-transferring) E1 component subunit alpha [Candidatus Hydrogenedentota bacterium]|nr:MAG: pyruvate dehydrogenase (acetyl-transferring) E1 component subunit alpha [Candidatus Hydrogenedentota bacterium]